MTTLSVRLFGRLCIQYQERDLVGLDARKAQELFCYLLMHRDRQHTREALASLLWGETSAAQSRANLRKTLWQLQAVLEALGQQPPDDTVLANGEWVQINPHANLWLDVAVFEQAFALVEGMPGESLDDARARAVEDAVQLYGGDLLDGWYHDWCLSERERLQSMYLALLDKLMGYCEACGMYERGLAHGSRALRYDQAREQTHRRLMRLHFLAGDRTAALRQYERCTTALDEELGVAPTDFTVALYKQIRANRLDDLPSPQPRPVMPNGPASLGGLLEQLRQLEDGLTAMQRQVRQHIQAVEQAQQARR